MEYNHPICGEVWINDIVKNAKTGDLILFKALDNYNSSKTFCYYTHVGVVYNGMLFEAAGTTGMDLYDSENKNGIFLEDLKTRLSRYKGKLYYKPLNKPVDTIVENNFTNFISYAMKYMFYEYGVVWNGIKKGLGLEHCHNGTNCGEMVFLSLIKLGILCPSRYKESVFHHLHKITNLTNADFSYSYNPIQRIKISPFS